MQSAHEQLDHGLQRKRLELASASDWTPAFHLHIVQASPEQTQDVLHELMRTGTQAMLAVAGSIEQSSPSMRIFAGAALK